MPATSDSIRSARYTWVVPECPICRREFDGRLPVFAPPGGEAYDTIDCARRAVSAPGVEQLLAPTLLPTIELLPLGATPAGAPPARLPARSRRRLAAAIAVPLVASPAAVAAGLSLVAAGTATSVYLGSPAFEGGGRVVAAPAAPAELPKPEPSSEAPTPPPSTPVTDEPEQAKPELKARVVVLADSPGADTTSHIESDIAETAPTETVVAPASSPGQHTSPSSPVEGSSPHRPQPAKPPPPVAPPPQTTPPPEAAEEPVASTSPPPSHHPHSASAPPIHDPHAKDKDKNKDSGGDGHDGDD